MMRLKLEEQAAVAFQHSSETRNQPEEFLAHVEPTGTPRLVDLVGVRGSFCFEVLGCRCGLEGEIRGEGGFSAHSSREASQLVIEYQTRRTQEELQRRMRSAHSNLLRVLGVLGPLLRHRRSTVTNMK